MNSSLDSFSLSLTDFEGPLPLLLRLIERNELEISRVSVAAVADQFIALAAAGQPHDLASTGEFLVLTARLLLIKSRAILTRGASETGDDVEDDAETLARQITAYLRYHGAARSLAARLESYCQTNPRISASVAQRSSTAQPPIRIDTLTRSAHRLFHVDRDKVEAVARWPELVYSTVKDDLLTEVRRLRRTTFAELCKGARPLVVITMFLAVLDAVRMEELALCQKFAFGRMELAAVSGDGVRA